MTTKAVFFFGGGGGGGYDLNVLKAKSCYKVVSTFGRLIVFVFLGWGRLQIDCFRFLGVGQASD